MRYAINTRGISPRKKKVTLSEAEDTNITQYLGDYCKLRISSHGNISKSEEF